jgi:hypothetical protein
VGNRRRLGQRGLLAGMCVRCQLAEEAIMAPWAVARAARARARGVCLLETARNLTVMKWCTMASSAARTCMQRGLRCVGVVHALLLWDHELIDAARPPPPPMSSARDCCPRRVLHSTAPLPVSSATIAGVVRQALSLARDVSAYSRHGALLTFSPPYRPLRTARLRPNQRPSARAGHAHRR